MPVPSDPVAPPPQLPDPPTGAHLPLHAQVRVRTYELDSFGHVNNAVYLQYCEEARSEFLQQIGLSFHDLTLENVQLIVIEAQIRYVSPSRYGDTLDIWGGFTNVRGASFTIEYRMTQAETGILVAEAQTRGAIVNAQTGRPVRPPARFVEAFHASGMADTPSSSSST